MTVIPFPPGASPAPDSADEQSSAAFIPSSSDAALSCSAFGRVGACGDAAPGASLDPNCNAPTAVSIRLTKRVSRPEPGPGAERPGFILDCVAFNRALAEYDA